MGNPWAFKIDYARAIAQDEAEIAMLDGVTRQLAATLSETEVNWFCQGFLFDGWRLLIGSPERREERMRILGVSDAEFEAACFVGEPDGVGLDGWNEEELKTRARAGAAAVDRPGTYKLGEEVIRRLEVVRILPESHRVSALRKARASLARHRRNSAQFGGR